MDIEAGLNELTKRVRDHREVLLTEEAAKNALIMPFLQHLGFDVFNPAEVVPEYVCDVGTKKGEKVDYAICMDNEVKVLIECKPSSIELNLKNASQLYRYFSVTSSRLAVLTNGVIYKFFSDIDYPNKMDDKPFYTLNLEAVRKSDIRTVEKFHKDNFDIEKIVQEAANLKNETLVRTALEHELDTPSDELVKIITTRVYDGRFTAQIKDLYAGLIRKSISNIIRDKVNDRLSSALSGVNKIDDEEDTHSSDDNNGIVTTQIEVDGFNIIRAISSQAIDMDRLFMRDAKSYCAVLLDDNNRKPVARLHFNSETARYVGTFVGKEENRHSVERASDLYKFQELILARIAELTA